jgi:lysozyme family protein
MDGGGTRFGISYNTFKRVYKKEGAKKCDNDKDGKLSLNDLRLLTMSQAKAIYKKNYWDVVGGDYIDSQLVAEMMYDYVIHGGLSVKKIQMILKMKKVDGIIGKETIKAINSSNKCILLSKIYESRVYWLFKVMPKSRPQTFKNCKRGWANRLNYYSKLINKECHENVVKAVRI